MRERERGSWKGEIKKHRGVKLRLKWSASGGNDYENNFLEPLHSLVYFHLYLTLFLSFQLSLSTFKSLYISFSLHISLSFFAYISLSIFISLFISTIPQYVSFFVFQSLFLLLFQWSSLYKQVLMPSSSYRG